MQVMVNASVRVGTRVSLFSYYTLNYANSDTSGASSFPSNQYDLALDYGRASFDVRHRLFLGGTLALPYKFPISPMLLARPVHPFNVTTRVDSNGAALFNDR